MAGEIIITADGSEIGSGPALFLYLELKREHTQSNPLHDPTKPPAEWADVDDLAAWHRAAVEQNVRRMREWAQNANAIARWYAALPQPVT